MSDCPSGTGIQDNYACGLTSSSPIRTECRNNSNQYAIYTTVPSVNNLNVVNVSSTSDSWKINVYSVPNVVQGQAEVQEECETPPMTEESKHREDRNGPTVEESDGKGNDNPHNVDENGNKPIDVDREHKDGDGQSPTYDKKHKTNDKLLHHVHGYEKKHGENPPDVYENEKERNDDDNPPDVYEKEHENEDNPLEVNNSDTYGNNPPDVSIKEEKNGGNPAYVDE